MRSSALTDALPHASQPTRFLAALFNRNFRYLWLSFSCSSVAQRMDGVVLGWLVLELTDSAFLVGLVGALRFGGALLGPLTGVVADRCDRRRLLITSLVMMSTIVLALCVLVAVRRLEVWHLFVATTLWGILWAIHQPAQQSLQADILSGRVLVNGISLMNTAMNAASIVGPAFAGALLACCGAAGPGWEWSEDDMAVSLNWHEYHPGRFYAVTDEGTVVSSSDQGATWGASPLALPGATVRAAAAAAAVTGVQWAYLVLLGFHLLQLFLYAAMRLEPQAASVTHTSVWQNLLAGLRYSCGDAGLWTPLAMAGMLNMVAFPLQFGLLPVFARDVFSVGAAGLGLLGAALGVGSFVGSLLMAALGTLQHAGWLMLVGTMLWLVSLIGFAITPEYSVALGVLIVLGIAQTMALTNIAILLLGTASGEMRGRVMGLRSLAVAPLFPGGALAGAAAGSIGAPATTIICAVVGLVLMLWIAPWVPRRLVRQK
jgi:MFS family permease